MKINVSRFSMVGLVILIGLLATRCTQPGDSAQEIAPAPASSVPLTYVSYWNTSSPANADDELVERFQEAYPHIKVNRSVFNESSDDYLTSSISPDVMTWDAAVMYDSAANRVQAE